MVDAISQTPWWVIPGVLATMFGLMVTMFGIGSAAQKRRGDVVTQAILRQKMDACQKSQLAANTAILDEMKVLSAERRDIWEIVRETAKSVSVMGNDLEWIKQKLSNNGRA